MTIKCGPHCTYWRYLSRDKAFCDNPELKKQYEKMGSVGPGLREGQFCGDGKHINTEMEQ